MSHILHNQPQRRTYSAIPPRQQQGNTQAAHIVEQNLQQTTASLSTDSFTSTNTQAERDVAKAAREFEEKLQYLPKKDASYKDKASQSFLQSFSDYISRLPLICHIPLIGDKEFKNEYEQYCARLNTTNKPPLETTISALLGVTKLLNSKGYMTERSWRTISRSFQQLMTADLYHQLSAFDKAKPSEVDKINPFESCSDILNTNAIRTLHPFVIAALEDLPHLKDINRLNPHTLEKLKLTVRNLLTKATLKTYENVAMRNMGLILESGKTERISNFEAELLTQIVKTLPTTPTNMQAAAKVLLYQNREISVSNMPKDRQGFLLLPTENLSSELLEQLKSSINTTADFNQRYVESTFALSKSLAKQNKKIKQYVARQVQQSLIREFPSGTSIRAMGKFLKDCDLTDPREVDQFATRVLTDPSLKYYRLAAADMLRKNQLLSPEALEAKLRPLGIKSRNLEYYDLGNTEALKARMEAEVIGQRTAKQALWSQLSKLTDRKTPLLYLDGAYGAGKTSLGLKLAQQMNTSRTRQNYATGLEFLEASERTAPYFNAGVIETEKLFEADDLNTFRRKLMTQLKAISENAQKFPGRPTTLIFDEIGRTVEEYKYPTHQDFDANDPDLPHQKQMTEHFAKTLLQLIDTQQYTDPNSGKTISFNQPVVFLTGNVSKEKESQDPMDTALFDPYFVGNETANALRSRLNERMNGNPNTVEFDDFQEEDRQALVQQYTDTLLPATAALKGYHLSLLPTPAHFVETLTQAYDSQDFVGRSIAIHFKHALNLIKNDDNLNPGETMAIKINPTTLQRLTIDNVASNNPFEASYINT